jgi:hypothetical protein
MIPRRDWLEIRTPRHGSRSHGLVKSGTMWTPLGSEGSRAMILASACDCINAAS